MHSHLNRRVLNLVVFPYLAAARTARAASSSSSAAVCASPDEPWAETGPVNRARYEPNLLRSVDWAKAARRKGKAREFDSQDGHNREARDISDKQGRPPDRLRAGTASIDEPGPSSCLASHATPSQRSSTHSFPKQGVSLPPNTNTPHTSRPSSRLPKSLHILLSDRLYRLAYFHLIETLNTNPARFERWFDRGVVDRTLATLEKNGAHKVAAALRWKVGQVLNRQLESGKRASTYQVNTKLSDLLSSPSPLSALRLPPDVRPSELPKEFGDMKTSLRRAKPPPTAALHQVRRVISLISKARTQGGFEPDWVTANIVLKAWLRGVVQDVKDPKSGLVVKHIPPDTVRRVFRAISEKAGVPSRAGEYAKVHRPLGKMFIKAMKTRGDREGVESVIQWLRDMRDGAA